MLQTRQHRSTMEPKQSGQTPRWRPHKVITRPGAAAAVVSRQSSAGECSFSIPWSWWRRDGGWRVQRWNPQTLAQGWYRRTRSCSAGWLALVGTLPGRRTRPRRWTRRGTSWRGRCRRGSNMRTARSLSAECTVSRRPESWVCAGSSDCSRRRNVARRLTGSPAFLSI